MQKKDNKLKHYSNNPTEKFPRLLANMFNLICPQGLNVVFSFYCQTKNVRNCSFLCYLYLSLFIYQILTKTVRIAKKIPCFFLQIDEKRIREVTKKIGLELTDVSFDEPDSSKQPEMFVLKDKNITEIRNTLDNGNNETILVIIIRTLIHCIKN